MPGTRCSALEEYPAGELGETEEPAVVELPGLPALPHGPFVELEL